MVDIKRTRKVFVRVYKLNNDHYGIEFKIDKAHRFYRKLQYHARYNGLWVSSQYAEFDAKEHGINFLKEHLRLYSSLYIGKGKKRLIEELTLEF